MTDICLYFQVHQPLRLSKFSFFDIGQQKEYFDEKANKFYLERVARKCYKPANEAILRLINETDGKFKVNYSITGILLDQLEDGFPDVIESFQKIADTGCCEFFNETYYHSLSWLVSKKEFIEQVKLHRKRMKQTFGVKPKVFRNTEAMYSNEIAQAAEELGFKGIVCEGIDRFLGWRSPNYVYKAKGSDIRVLSRNYKLSDDIAFRFSEHSWSEFPLTADKYASWLSSSQGDCINLFMDYETFGEHQWQETGIFNFLSYLPNEVLKHKHLNFALASDIIKNHMPRDEFDVPGIVSWADVDRDLSAWLENRMQQQAFSELKNLEPHARKAKGKVLEDWRRLQISDHFYYMCTKWFADGDVHKYFNPYENPYDAFINYMNVINDLKKRAEN
ncbi:MAG: glycoside hydrolase family 57 protein [Candidatus Diapherotrites archaeon]|nr:glycoside hydrolase family 57 protein [Candidatus Diapherotrites archaeon]